LNAGSLDFAITGETPPVFAQAAKGSPLVYVANEPASPQGEGLVVKADSGIKNVADLKGKTVTTAKGSNAHYFLIQALAKAGLTPSDINLIYLYTWRLPMPGQRLSAAMSRPGRFGIISTQPPNCNWERAR